MCGRVGLIYGESAGKFGREFAGVPVMIQLPQLIGKRYPILLTVLWIALIQRNINSDGVQL